MAPRPLNMIVENAERQPFASETPRGTPCKSLRDLCRGSAQCLTLTEAVASHQLLQSLIIIPRYVPIDCVRMNECLSLLERKGRRVVVLAH